MNDPDKSCVWMILILTVFRRTITVDVCFKKPETLTCGTLLKPNGVHEVEWKVYNAEEKQWSCFSYCGKRQGCLIKEKLLSNGITVENVSMVAVTMKASAKDNTNKHSRLLCEVHYKDSVAYKEVKINFIECITTEKGTDLNLTKVFQDMLPWENVKSIFIENSHGSKLAYCDTGDCIKENGGDFLNRLQVKRGALILSEIMESDDGLKFNIKVDLRTGNVRGSMGTTRVYSIKIFVYSKSGSTGVPPSTLPSTTGSNRTNHSPVKHVASPTRSSASTTDGNLLIMILIPAFLVLIAVICLFRYLVIRRKRSAETASAQV